MEKYNYKNINNRIHNLKELGDSSSQSNNFVIMTESNNLSNDYSKSKNNSTTVYSTVTDSSCYENNSQYVDTNSALEFNKYENQIKINNQIGLDNKRKSFISNSDGVLVSNVNLDTSNDSDNSEDTSEDNSEDNSEDDSEDFSDNSVNYSDSSTINSNDDISSESDFSEKYKDNEMFENKIYNKYFSDNLFIKYDDEIKKSLKNIDELEKIIIVNNYNQLNQKLNNGEYIFKKINMENPKLCSNPNCNRKKECKKECFKNSMYRCLRNTNWGIKSIYHLIFKLIMYNPKYRNFCKCCEDKQELEYLNMLDKNFVDKKENLTDGIKTKLEPKIIIDLQVNYLLNKFMNVIGVLPCECRFRKKYLKFYKDNYLNFKETIKIYTRTIPNVIKLLKFTYDIKDNHEELRLIKDSRCIHEDIRFNNLTYCKKKKYQDVKIKKIQEIIMNMDILNDWILESIKIGIHMYNQQSLEYFIYVMKKNKSSNLIKNFERIYSLSNDLLDLNYVSNKRNLFNCILDKSSSISDNLLNNLINSLKNQYLTRNKKYYDKYNINDIFINYIIESFKKSNIKLGLEFLKHIGNLSYKKEYDTKLEYIFETLLIEDSIDIKTKVSYLKIINKNKINVIKYDVVNQLISNVQGDKIIKEFNKEENSLFDLDEYKNKEYVINIIKKCIINNKVNILDYVLNNLYTFIINNGVEPVFIYMITIPKDFKLEYIYTQLLETILKYNYNVNLMINLEELNEKISLISYCISNSYNITAKYLLDKNIEYEKDILFKCIENKNHIIFGYIINKNPQIINVIKNDETIITYLFEKAEKNNYEKDVLMRFLLKIGNQILKNKIKDDIINFQDFKNELFGFKILNSNLSKEDKILLFEMLKNNINSIEINKYEKNGTNMYNFPLIIYSVLLNEYEITYTLLNYLFKNGIIKKNTLSETGTVFDYTHTSNKININFIPIVFKFLQDNYDHKKTNYEEKNYENNLILETDIFAIRLFLLVLQLVITNLINLSSSGNISKSSNIWASKGDESITSENNINQMIKNKYKLENRLRFDKYNGINELNGHNGYIELSIEASNNNILETESNDEFMSNKNIWLNSNTSDFGNKIKRNDNLKIKNKTNKVFNMINDNSSISESEICFEN